MCWCDGECSCDGQLGSEDCLDRCEVLLGVVSWLMPLVSSSDFKCSWGVLSSDTLWLSWESLLLSRVRTPRMCFVDLFSKSFLTDECCCHKEE